ncbi:MAG: exodeoxyribonuclease VII small subunit [Anaerolineae bacterium]|nr:exodeoxyribonuclease VII small subunit [Thermoflexales bacterium]MDW8408095.1 exodeoxyribonuclease VII small subunit [Anaerolineae bacterium]
MSKQQIRRPAEAPAQAGEQTLTFEQAYHELEQIVEQLERGDLPLEQMLALHARGQHLAALCSAQLDQAELKIRTVSNAQ